MNASRFLIWLWALLHASMAMSQKRVYSVRDHIYADQKEENKLSVKFKEDADDLRNRTSDSEIEHGVEHENEHEMEHKIQRNLTGVVVEQKTTPVADAPPTGIIEGVWPRPASLPPESSSDGKVAGSGPGTLRRALREVAAGGCFANFLLHIVDVFYLNIWLQTHGKFPNTEDKGELVKNCIGILLTFMNVIWAVGLSSLSGPFFAAVWWMLYPVILFPLGLATIYKLYWFNGEDSLVNKNGNFENNLYIIIFCAESTAWIGGAGYMALYFLGT